MKSTLPKSMISDCGVSGRRAHRGRGEAHGGQKSLNLFGAEAVKCDRPMAEPSLE
jgi:hypothetical protein